MAALPTQIGSYPVLKALGSGAMGSVYQAQHPRLGLAVAIKILHERDPEVMARFRREAEVMARIKDPRVVEVYEAGLHEGEPFLVMEYCPGSDLADLLKERGALPPREAAALVAEIARGVAAAHAAGVIHRDLKPANVLVGHDGRPKVTDFGIAAAARAGKGQSLTATGVILGTPAYMAPEQAMDAREVDARSDVYALGAILYECLAGRRPFTGPSGLVVLGKVIEGAADPLPAGLPPELVEIVTCALSLDPADRFTNATLFAEALEEFGLAPSEAPSKLLPLVLGAGLVAVLALLGLWQLSSAIEAPAESPAATPTPTPTPTPSPALTPSPASSVASVKSEIPPFGTEAYFRDKRRFIRVEIDELERCAALGHPAAMLELAKRFSEGRGTTLDYARALSWLERAGDAGDPSGLRNAADFYRLGRGTAAPDEKRAEEFFQRALKAGSYVAHLDLAGRGSDPAVKQRRRVAAWGIARRYARKGDPTATGDLAQRAIVDGDLAETRKWAELGVRYEARQALVVAAFLARGRANPAKAEVLSLFKRAAKLGHAEGTLGVARCLAFGAGTPRDIPAAEALLEGLERAGLVPVGIRFERIQLAWAKGERADWKVRVKALLAKRMKAPSRCYADLGIHLLEVIPELESTADRSRGLGRMVTAFRRGAPLRSLDARVSYNLAAVAIRREGLTPYRLKLYRRAAALGHPKGHFSVAEVLLEEKRPRVKEGIKHLRAAGELGLSAAWRRLARLYGMGVEGQLPRNQEEAEACLRRAAALNDVEAVLALSNGYMGRGDFSEARRYAEQAKRLGSVGGELDLALILLAEGEGNGGEVLAAIRFLESHQETSSRACVGLLNVYQLGLGVPKNEAKAAEYRARRDRLLAKERASDRPPEPSRPDK